MNLNKVFLIGRLTQDPEVRSTPSGQTVATVRMATNRVWNNQATGQKQDATEFHSVVAWGRLAEIASQYLKKGSLAMFEGRLQTRSWDDKNTGQKRYMTEIVAESLQLGPRSAGGFGEASPRPAGSSYETPVGGFTPRASAVARPAAKTAPSEPEIPIIQEDELTRSGVEESEMPLKDDLPF